MKVVFVALVAALVAVHEPVTVDDIDSAIEWLTRSAPRSNPMQTDTAMRREVAISIHSAIHQWPVSPWLVLVVIHGESSFKMASEGADGERGLMQINTDVFHECVRDEYDMDSAHGQIKCGTRHLHRQIEKHGELGGLIQYASGHYGDHTIRTQRKMEYRILKSRRLASRPWER